jgi:hypothetical protein
MSPFDMSKFNLPMTKDKPIPEENYLKSFTRPHTRSIQDRTVDLEKGLVYRKSRRNKSMEDYYQRYANDPLRLRSEDNVLSFDSYQRQVVTERATNDLKRRHTNTLDNPENTSAVEESNMKNPSTTTTDGFSVGQTPSPCSDRHSVITSKYSSGSSLFPGGILFDSDQLLYVPLRNISDENLSLRSEYSVTNCIDFDTATAAAAADTSSSSSSPANDVPSPTERSSPTIEGLSPNGRSSPTIEALSTTDDFSSINEALSTTDGSSPANQAPSSQENESQSP